MSSRGARSLSRACKTRPRARFSALGFQNTPSASLHLLVVCVVFAMGAPLGGPRHLLLRFLLMVHVLHALHALRALFALHVLLARIFFSST